MSERWHWLGGFQPLRVFLGYSCFSVSLALVHLTLGRVTKDKLLSSSNMAMGWINNLGVEIPWNDEEDSHWQVVCACDLTLIAVWWVVPLLLPLQRI
jgi:hypothetical protein